mmetsp:Transcript_101078/g.324688  ORF Transcript_101078/g.324688 Transcript_101078/m.324688 type:complete len:305 (+) Transcript_101078:1426-2340(+)
MLDGHAQHTPREHTQTRVRVGIPLRMALGIQQVLCVSLARTQAGDALAPGHPHEVILEGRLAPQLLADVVDDEERAAVAEHDGLDLQGNRVEVLSQRSSLRGQHVEKTHPRPVLQPDAKARATGAHARIRANHHSPPLRAGRSGAKAVGQVHRVGVGAQPELAVLRHADAACARRRPGALRRHRLHALTQRRPDTVETPRVDHRIAASRASGRAPLGLVGLLGLRFLRLSGASRASVGVPRELFELLGLRQCIVQILLKLSAASRTSERFPRGLFGLLGIRRCTVLLLGAESLIAPSPSKANRR